MCSKITLENSGSIKTYYGSCQGFCQMKEKPQSYIKTSSNKIVGNINDFMAVFTVCTKKVLWGQKLQLQS